MRKTKTEFKWFTIPQYRQEEEYLTSMHRKGWKFTKVSFPGFYHFEQCEPENVTYRLDYNQEGVANKAEYVQMFSDCGWEYLFDFVGYSYFRKASDEADTNEEIFCDDEACFQRQNAPTYCDFSLWNSSSIYYEYHRIWWRKFHTGCTIHYIFVFRTIIYCPILCVFCSVLSI